MPGFVVSFRCLTPSLLRRVGVRLSPAPWFPSQFATHNRCMLCKTPEELRHVTSSLILPKLEVVALVRRAGFIHVLYKQGTDDSSMRTEKAVQRSLGSDEIGRMGGWWVADLQRCYGWWWPGRTCVSNRHLWSHCGQSRVFPQTFFVLSLPPFLSGNWRGRPVFFGLCWACM